MQRSKLAEEKPADDIEDFSTDAAEHATKRIRRTAAAQKDTSAGLVRHAASDNEAEDPARDNEKAFRRLRRASRENLSTDSAAGEHPAAEASAAMIDGEAAGRAAKPGSPAEAQEPAASTLQIVSGPVIATADVDKDTAATEEAREPAAGAERRLQPRKGQPKAAAQEAAGADNPAVKVSADGPLTYQKHVPAGNRKPEIPSRALWSSSSLTAFMPHLKQSSCKWNEVLACGKAWCDRPLKREPSVAKPEEARAGRSQKGGSARPSGALWL